MNIFTLPNILLIASASSILLALSLAGGSLSKSVKWNLYNSGTNYGVKGGDVVRLYAYQTLWTSYDGWKGKNDKVNSQAYTIIKRDSWRRLPRLLVTTTMGIGAFSLAILLPFSLIPFLKRKHLLLNIARITSSVLSVAAGIILGYALNYYKSKYRQMLAPVFYDPTSFYPDEDNVSTGYYMASTACALLFISAIMNIVNVVIFIKAPKSKVTPEDPVTAMEEKRETAMPERKESAIQEKKEAAVKEAAIKEKRETCMQGKRETSMPEKKESAIKGKKESAMPEKKESATQEKKEDS